LFSTDDDNASRYDEMRDPVVAEDNISDEKPRKIHARHRSPSYRFQRRTLTTTPAPRRARIGYLDVLRRARHCPNPMRCLARETALYRPPNLNARVYFRRPGFDVRAYETRSAAERDEGTVPRDGSNRSGKTTRPTWSSLTSRPSRERADGQINNDRKVRDRKQRGQGRTEIRRVRQSPSPDV